jgi:hypothetical protein
MHEASAGTSPDHVPAWVDALEPGAPDIVAAWRGIETGRLIEVRREVRRRGGPGTASSIGVQLGSLAEALAAFVDSVPDDVLALPGGEVDWNVAQCIGHDCESRVGLCMAASLAASDRWPPDAPTVIQGIPGAAHQDRALLLRKIAQSQRLVDRFAPMVAGHESEPCPLVHPQVGRLRCGEWLVFAGVHDLMHLEQLHEIRAGIAA